MLIVDTHAHLFSPDEKKYQPRKDPSRPPEGKGTLDHLREELHASDVDAACAVQVSGFYGFDNSYVLDVAKEHSSWIAGIVTLDPDRTDSPRKLRSLAKKPGVRGVRSVPAGGRRMDDMGVRALWTAARDARLPVNLLIGAELADEAARLIEDFPDLIVVLDHALKLQAGPGVRDTLAALDRLAQYPNVYCKVTSIANGPEGCKDGFPCKAFHDPILRTIDLFGPDRCAWGAHFPLEKYSPSLRYDQAVAIFAEELPLSQSDRAAILGETANRLWFGGRLRDE